MNTPLKLGLGAAVAAVVIAVTVFFAARPDENTAFATPGFEDMTARELSSESYLVVPEMLASIYLAFGEVDEAAIYDKLAEVSAKDALETLYLERVGAMAGGGLEEADQELHAMELTNLSSRQNGTTVAMDVEWHVVGTVGHATHMHVRGNTYAANLTVEPVSGAWRITDFDLTDVDRSDAGEMVAAE